MWRAKTLASRLFFLSAIVAIVGIGIVAWFLSNEYSRETDSRFREILTANIFNLMGSFEVSSTGDLIGLPDLGDPRYNSPESGWYWQVTSTSDNAKRSSSVSLADEILIVDQSAPLTRNFQRYFVTSDKSGNDLLALEAQVFLGEGDTIYSFVVTANADEINLQVASFTNRLAVVLSIFALSLIIASYLVVRFGLRPLSVARDNLVKVREGRSKTIEGDYPEEISPLIEETNALISSNQRVVERARTQVGNLAHSLKTPIAVLQNETGELKPEKQNLFSDQLGQMQRQVQNYLDRARLSARAHTAIQKTQVAPVLKQLCEVIGKLNPNIEIIQDFEGNSDLIFHGEESDFQEITGNLMENAAKFAKNKIIVSLAQNSKNSGQLIIFIEDDGPGMTENEIAQAMKRGARIDEAQQGWGLGLSIVRDIIEEYQGTLKLYRSNLGGLAAEVRL